jgi:hypothetical protein
MGEATAADYILKYYIGAAEANTIVALGIDIHMLAINRKEHIDMNPSLVALLKEIGSTTVMGNS